MKYQKMKKSRYRKQLNEANDCSVIAIALVCRLTYKEAHSRCCHMGRKARKGMTNWNILLTAKYGNFNMELVKNLRQKSGSLYTPKTIGEKLKRGYYLCFCNGHVLSVINGHVHDWTNGRQHRITEAWKVTRIQS